MIKCFIGNKLSQLYERHLEKALDMSYTTPEEEQVYEEYYTYGLGKFKWDIVYDTARRLTNNGDYTNCITVKKVNGMKNWYRYSYIFSRIFEGKSLFNKIKLLFY